MVAEPDAVGPADTEAVLRHGTVSLEGRLIEASNATFFGTVSLDGIDVECVYKPIRGERPLWDFPHGTLADREVAAYVVSELAGWRVVPPTVIGDGPFGPGMVQAWVPDSEVSAYVDVVPAGSVPDGWLHVLDAVDMDDEPVMLIHRDAPGLESMAVFDVVANNADRKGGHVLTASERVLGCDHGLTFHEERKLRTILWGWAGRSMSANDIAALDRLADAMDEPSTRLRLEGHLTFEEVEQLCVRVERLRRSGRHPRPSRDSRVIPWPAI